MPEITEFKITPKLENPEQVDIEIDSGSLYLMTINRPSACLRRFYTDDANQRCRGVSLKGWGLHNVHQPGGNRFGTYESVLTPEQARKLAAELLAHAEFCDNPPPKWLARQKTEDGAEL